MKKNKLFIIAALQIACSITFAQSSGLNHPATDDLDRKLPTYNEVGDIREDKTVALFYWTWHSGHSQNPYYKAFDLSKIIDGHPEMVNDFDNPLWAPYGGEGGLFFWTEPLFDFYDGMDRWVIRRQLEMIGAAGVDVIFYDATNIDLVWKTGYDAVGEVMDEMRADGVATPQFAFMLNFGPTVTAASELRQLYDDIYSKDKYKDSWFMWKGKPVIMAYPESLNLVGDAANAGQKFTASSDFTKIGVQCPSYANNIGNFTLSLYNWSENYSNSVSQEPLAVKEFVNFNDNVYLDVEFNQLPAGEYVWELSDPVESVGIWKYIEDTEGVISYFNGAAVSGEYVSHIHYVSDGVFSPLATGDGATHVDVPVPGGMDPVKKELIRDFFTYRPGQPGMNTGSQRSDQWGWLEISPQHQYINSADGYELVPVGIAQNWSDEEGGLTAMNAGPTVRGRSYTTTDGFSKLTDESYKQGYNFQEQWDRALELDPQIIFITGWNEWVMGRYREWPPLEAHQTIPQVGKPVNNAFPDQFSNEYSRDIEPMKGGYGDNYYCQMISNIRKFKGMEQPQIASEAKTIEIDGVFDEWNSVEPGFKASKGNTEHRDGYGYFDPDNPGQHLHYTNTTGRNDIVLAKVARDTGFVYFYVETDQALTPASDWAWMRLFIDVDRDHATGWEGYDYMLNRVSPGTKALLERNVGGDWVWTRADTVEYAVSGKGLEVKIPKSSIGLAPDDKLAFEFKWSDNMQDEGNIMDFYLNGDVAPIGRMNFAYSTYSTIGVEPVISGKRTEPGLKSYPNPFQHETTIEYSLPETMNVDLIIYDSVGREIRSLSRGIHSGGTHQVKWNGTGESGNQMAPGIYFCRLVSGNGSGTGCTLLKMK
ncbi:MAG: FlgD immunoglobulin-like domain containing protein [Bacteroidota bacterium]